MAVAGKRKPTSRNVHDVGLNDDSIVGVFGLTASYSLLLGRLTSKLADVLVVGVLRPSAFRPLRVRSLMSKLMGFFLGRGGGI